MRFQFDRLVRTLGTVQLEKKIDVGQTIQPVMIVIPALNEAENLKSLLPKIPDRINSTPVGVMVIDDGSDDETVAVVRENGCMAISNLINRGGGAALRLGYDILQKTGGTICVTMDADGQHRPEDIEALVKPILNNEYDFVIGSRILGEREKDSAFRLVGVYLFGFLISFLLGKKITDPSSNFRAFRMDSLKSIHLYEDQYHTSELIIEAVKKGMRIGEVPITILKRKYGKSKKGGDVLYGFHFARVILKAWWR
ncbi:MAG: glycosyltransferase family 2 protein [Desulfobacteraceae bacterium]|nr:glycosyltransferase family 2 protein [Desulfobacteraceae bacterium]